MYRKLLNSALLCFVILAFFILVFLLQPWQGVSPYQMIETMLELLSWHHLTLSLLSCSGKYADVLKTPEIHRPDLDEKREIVKKESIEQQSLFAQWSGFTDHLLDRHSCFNSE